MLSTKHNFLFIHIPKTGGNAIQKALLPYSDDQMVFTNDMHDGIDRFEIRSQAVNIHKHSSLEDYRSQLDKPTFEELFKISCVRNPWDRCVSFFFSPHRGPVDWSVEEFTEFIKSTVKPHAHFLKTSTEATNYFENIDFYIRFEQMAEDFRALCKKLQIDNLQLSHINKSNREGYQKYYQCQQTIDLVADIFQDEIQRFQYTF